MQTLKGSRTQNIVCYLSEEVPRLYLLSSCVRLRKPFWLAFRRLIARWCCSN